MEELGRQSEHSKTVKPRSANSHSTHQEPTYHRSLKKSRASKDMTRPRLCLQDEPWHLAKAAAISVGVKISPATFMIRLAVVSGDWKQRPAMKPISAMAVKWMGVLGGTQKVNFPSRTPGRVYFFHTSSMKKLDLSAVKSIVGNSLLNISSISCFCCFRIPMISGSPTALL